MVDAYTRRMLVRHGWMPPESSYDATVSLFIQHIPRDVALYNEYHALIVMLGKDYCRTKPQCNTCPLRRWLPNGGPCTY